APPPVKSPPPAVGCPDNAEIMAVLAKTQNKCFAEMGYYPTLLQEFNDLKRHCAVLSADNQKLYSDNHNLAQFIQMQEQRIKILTADAQNKHPAEADERVRALTSQRDEIAGRLHGALNEILLLRQELSRFFPSAVMVPAHERIAHPQHAAPQRVVPMPGQQPVPLQQQHRAHTHIASFYVHRPIQPLPTARAGHPNLSPIDTSALPTIAHHRRTSAPALAQYGTAASPTSPSPVANFQGLSLTSPATPASSRPSTAGAAPAPSAGFSQWRLPAGPARPVHGAPAQPLPQRPQKATPNSLAGVVIDLTADDPEPQDGARKRRKTEHAFPMAPPASQSPMTQQPTVVHPLAGPSTNGQTPPVSAAAVNVPQRTSSAPLPTPATQLSPAVIQPKNDSTIPSSTDEDVAMEPQPTLEEDCVGECFEEDDEDENKLWCTMCRSRYKTGHTTEPPTPFVNAPQEELVKHCETVHPRGWEILKQRMAEQRASENPV
ncbi:hypothetical protein BD413DRAFT_475123, partial [Trametes elegans]